MRDRFHVLVVFIALGWQVVAAAPVGAQYVSIATIAGNGKVSTDNIQPVSQPLETAIRNPFGIEPDSRGNLVIASFDGHVLYRLSADRQQLQWIAGTGREGHTGSDASTLALEVAMNQPHEIRLDSNDNIFVADTRNHRVGKIDAATNHWLNVAGTGEAGFSGDGGPANHAKFNQAYSIAIDGDQLFVADLLNQRVRQVDLGSGVIKTICGTGEKKRPKDGELAAAQPLDGPRSLAVDRDNLWIVMREGNAVWRIERHTGKIHHVAGTGEKGFEGDGDDARQCRLNGPKGAAVHPGVALYIADTENHVIRKVDLKTHIISTIAGTGKAGFNGDGPDPVTRQLSRPHGVCWLKSGELLIGDSENHRVRLLTIR